MRQAYANMFCLIENKQRYMRGNMSPQPTSRIWLFKAESLEEENLFIANGFYGFGASEDAVDAVNLRPRNR